MTLKKLLIANRGEIAVRIARSAAEIGIQTVSVYSQDDALSLHTRRADEAVALGAAGARAYLDIERIVQLASEYGCDAVHPGYGFLSENAQFARCVERAGISFVGPTPHSLELLGDKVSARRLAQECGVPTIPGTSAAASVEDIEGFFDSLPLGSSIMIKAVSGGGGRGMRRVSCREEIGEAFERCRSEAKAAFGNDALYIERFIARARHLEVQILGDGSGECVHLGERECTLQRRNQKIVEVAPSPSIDESIRNRLFSAALTLAESQKYRSLGTFEFLLDLDLAPEEGLFFIEANPRIQVEHTVTEEIFGIDLVRRQLEIAGGATLRELGLKQEQLPKPSGFAVQCRINMEQIDADGQVHPSFGTLKVFDLPSGSGVRIDSYAYTGYSPGSSFDSLLAKLIVHSPSPHYGDALVRTHRALREFRIEGIQTNVPYLTGLLDFPAVRENEITTMFVEQNSAEIAEAVSRVDPPLFVETKGEAAGAMQSAPVEAPAGAMVIPAPMQGTLLSVADEGSVVRTNQQIAILEAMKMEHAVVAPCAGRILKVRAIPGQMVLAEAALFYLEPDESLQDVVEVDEVIDPDHIRPDLAELYERRSFGRDENRGEAVAKRHARGQRTARENLRQLCDEDSFAEYGELAIAAQRQRRSLDDLIRTTSGDGVITGIGSVNGEFFGPETSRCAFIIYDAMVLAGTQGQMNHRKQDRILGVADKWQLPLILLAEGGGGRPGDTERAGLTGLDTKTFGRFARLSGKVPIVGVVSGRCYAGNAALLGCCDVIIATENANIGMAGPAMIEGGGLGIYRPEEIGPIGVQTANGVVDIRVEDEEAACDVAKKYISYFQGPIEKWKARDQRILRRHIPENRLRAYDVRNIVNVLADEGSVLELRRDFGVGIITALIRIEGRPFGLVANNSMHLGGAIDAPAADKASRFMQLCNAFGVPIVSLCDTPGFMVGPEAEKTALVRHVCRMFVAGANLEVPIFGVVLRKGYGLGAVAMFGGGFHESFFTVSWPTGEFGGMGLEGAVRLGFRKELEAIEDPAEKKALFDELLGRLYANGKAISVASAVEVDAVIDPIETRQWILRGYRSLSGDVLKTTGRERRAFVDTW